MRRGLLLNVRTLHRDAWTFTYKSRKTRTMPAIRDAIVLAAGLGARLPGYDVPKPLIPVAGAPLLRRTLNGLVAAGMERLHLVIGHQADAIVRQIAAWSWGPEVTLTTIFNNRYREPNGVSLAVCREALGSRPFILTMADHLFDAGIVADLARRGPPTDGVRLAVDTDIPHVFDLDDATKVLVGPDGERIVNIGKQLTDYNAVDTGLFVCSPAIFTALEAAFERGGFSLSDGMRALAQEGRFVAMPIDGRYWQDVDTPEMYAKAAEDLSAGKLPSY